MSLYQAAPEKIGIGQTITVAAPTETPTKAAAGGAATLKGI